LVNRVRQHTRAGLARSRASIDLNGRRMHVASPDPQGVVSPDTLVLFEQSGSVVSARYGGGAIVTGYLVGRFEADGALRFCYAQTDSTGRVDAGISTATIESMPSGRLRLIEQFQWLTRVGGGTNVFEEID